MKLKHINVCLSDSLLNNSEIKEDENAQNLHKAKSTVVIKASKSKKLFNKEAFLQNLENIDQILPIKTKIKSKRKSKMANRNSSMNDLNDSIVDLMVPKKRSSNFSNEELQRKSKRSFENLRTENNLSDNSSSKDEGNRKSTPSIDNKYLFKLPESQTQSDILKGSTSKIFNSKKKKSVKSPICSSSPKSELSNVRNNVSDFKNISFSSDIISSSEDFKYSNTKSDLKNLLSPIVISKSLEEKPSKNESKTAKLKNKSLISNRIKLKKSEVNISSIVTTKSGRESRPYSMSKKGKYFYEFIVGNIK